MPWASILCFQFAWTSEIFFTHNKNIFNCSVRIVSIPVLIVTTFSNCDHHSGFTRVLDCYDLRWDLSWLILAETYETQPCSLIGCSCSSGNSGSLFSFSLQLKQCYLQFRDNINEYPSIQIGEDNVHPSMLGGDRIYFIRCHSLRSPKKFDEFL